MKPLHVALVHPFVLAEVRRGGERYLDDLAHYLSGAGHRVDVITSSRRAGTEIVDGVHYRRRRRIGAQALARHHIGPMETFGPVAFTALIRHRYDIVHALTPSTALFGRASAHRTVYTTLGAPTVEQFEGRPNHLRLLNAAVRFANRTTAVSRAAARATEDLTGRPCTPLYPGVRLDRFLPNLRARTGPPRLLFCSDMGEPRKGLGVLLAALPAIVDHHAGARLQLCGPGDHRPALDSLDPAVRARVAPALDVVAPESILECYRNATVTVLPSRWEAFGLVLVESLASGTPVVCTSDGGMTEIVDRPDIGRVAAWGDAADLASAVIEAIDLAGRPATPARCREHAARWDWAATVGPAHEALYREVLHQEIQSARGPGRGGE